MQQQELVDQIVSTTLTSQGPSAHRMHVSLTEQVDYVEETLS